MLPGKVEVAIKKLSAGNPNAVWAIG